MKLLVEHALQRLAHGHLGPSSHWTRPDINYHRLGTKDSMLLMPAQPVEAGYTIMALETNHVFSFPDHFQTWNVIQRFTFYYNNHSTTGWESTYLMSLHVPYHLQASGIIELGMASSKTNSRRFLTLSYLLHTLVRRFDHWMQLYPERNHLFSAAFWVVIRMKGVGFYKNLFWNIGIPPPPFLNVMFFSFPWRQPHTNPADVPSEWYFSQKGA